MLQINFDSISCHLIHIPISLGTILNSFLVQPIPILHKISKIIINPWQGLRSNTLPSFRDMAIKTTQIEILPETQFIFNIIKNLCYMPKRGLQVTGQSINITLWNGLVCMKDGSGRFTFILMLQDIMWWSLRLQGVAVVLVVKWGSELKIRSIVVIELSVTLVGVDTNCYSWRSLVIESCYMRVRSKYVTIKVTYKKEWLICFSTNSWNDTIKLSKEGHIFWGMIHDSY